MGWSEAHPGRIWRAPHLPGDVSGHVLHTLRERALLYCYQEMQETLYRTESCDMLGPHPRGQQLLTLLTSCRHPGEGQEGAYHVGSLVEVSLPGRECLRTPQGHPYTRF